MEQIESQKIMVNKNGKEVECDLLFTFDSPDTGKVYMAYTDYSKDEDGLNNIYIYSFNPIQNQIESVMDSKELEMVDDVINEIRKKLHV